MNNIWVKCEIVQIDISIKRKPFAIKTLFKSCLLLASSNGHYIDIAIFGLKCKSGDNSFLFSFLMIFFILQTNSSSPSLLSSFSRRYTYLLSTPPPLLLSVGKVSHRSQHSLAHQVEAGLRPSPLYLGWARYSSIGMGFKKSIHALGINPNPTASGPTNCPSHTTVTHIQRA